MHTTIQFFDDAPAEVIVHPDDEGRFPIVELRQPDVANSVTLILPLPLWQAIADAMIDLGITPTDKES